MALRLKKVALSKALGIARNTLTKYLNSPGAPLPDAEGTFDVEGARLFCARKSDEAEAGNTSVSETEISRLRSQKIRMEIEHSRFLFEKQRGEYIHRSEIAATVWALQAESDAMYRQAFEHELPFKYKGKSAVECQQMNIQSLDGIAKRIKEGCLPLTGKEEKESA